MLPFQLVPGDLPLLFTGFAAVLAVLHLLAQKHRPQIVSSLQFWDQGQRNNLVLKAKLRRPLSLLLQALALALLLTALTNPHWGEPHPRRHVLLLDVSLGAPVDRERALLRTFLQRTPAADVLQPVRVDGLAAPLTGFTSDHAEILQALKKPFISTTSLDWPLAANYAQRARSSGSEVPGDIVYAGPSSPPATLAATLGRLRVLSVPALSGSSTALPGCTSRSQSVLRATLVTTRPDLWSAALRSLPNIRLTFVSPAEYPAGEPDLFVFDRYLPATVPAAPALYVNPPSASAVQGPNSEVISFDPFAEKRRFEAQTALMLRRTLERLAGKNSRPAEALTVPAGLISLPLQPAETALNTELWQGSRRVPFSVRDNTLFSYVPVPVALALESPVRQVTLCLQTPPSLPQLSGPSFPGMPPPLRQSFSWHAWQLCALGAALLLALEWWFYARRTTRSALLKASGVLAIFIALAGWKAPLASRSTALLAVIDDSDSIGPKAFAAARDFASKAGASTVTAFAERPHQLPGGSQPSSQVTRGRSGATDIEAGLLAALATTPEGTLPHLVLFSDGNETEGSALRGAAALREAGVPVDTLPWNGGEANTLSIDSLQLPDRAFSGETLPVELTVTCRQSTAAKLDLMAQGTVIGNSSFVCQPGTQRLQIAARVRGSGATLVTAHLSAPGYKAGAAQQAIVLSPAKALYISGDETLADTNFPDVLRKAGFALTESPRLPSSDLATQQLVILNNLDLDQLPAPQTAQLHDFVDAGGGLLVISGEHQTYHEQHLPTPLDAVLPARIRPPQTPEGIAIVLVIDKSSSMEGRKIHLARLSASAAVDHLRPVDTIGVLIFDNAFSWAVPLRHATDKPAIKQLIAGIIPDGGTQIPAALDEAYRRILTTKATYKHIVLLTDGISEEADSLSMAREALLHQVSISTVGLGQDVNKSYLQKIAEASGGYSYFLNDPAYLQELLLKDIEDFTAKTVVEKRVRPAVAERSAVFDGIGWASAPPLQGYVRYEARAGARTLLRVNGDPADPLLLRWQYGLGRAAVFASDAKSRWSSQWIGWPGFDVFWTNLARDLVQPNLAAADSLRAQVDRSHSLLRLSYRGTVMPQPYFFFGPSGAKGPLPWRKSGSTFTAESPIPWSPGMWMLRPEHATPEWPELALLAADSESRNAPVNQQLLADVAHITGGTYRPTLAQLQALAHRHRPADTPLWPLLLWAAITLLFVELAARKLGKPAVVAKNEMPEPMHILFR